MNITPDLQQNIIITGYLFFSHNAYPLALFLGLFIGIVLSFWKPSRFATLILMSFGILLFAYEYDKHIIAGLRDQTMRSLITETPHYKAQYVIDLLISDLAPIFLHATGWILLFIAIVYAGIVMPSASGNDRTIRQDAKHVLSSFRARMKKKT